VNTVSKRAFGERLLGAARLNVDVYEEVEADTSATKQAALVVCLVSIAAAIGSANAGPIVVTTRVLAALFGWLLWSAITYLIGDKLLRGTATWGELLRTVGFALAPGLLFMLMIVPAIGPAVRVIVNLWILVAAIIAIRQALDFGTGKAILTAVLGFMAWIALAVGLATLSGEAI
jgi:hypothetical protein